MHVQKSSLIFYTHVLLSQLAFDKLMENGITFVDTSENYGLSSKDKSLTAENILCKCLDTNTEAEPIIASTISNPWKSIVQGTGARFGRSGILKAIEGSGDRLGTSALDVYQVPAKMFHIGAPGAVTSALCMAMDQGLINNIGVKNFSKGKMKSFNQKLNKIGSYSITSNQFEFSLVNRKAWKSGLITECKRQGIIPVASNPLGDGLASGVYSATNPTGGKVSGKQPFKFETLEKYTTLHDMMLTVQTRVQKRLEKENLALKDRRDRYGGNDVSQVEPKCHGFCLDYISHIIFSSCIYLIRPYFKIVS
jgi:aryl-alcohol dehydrogenase-like predicted oxidoreductase